ncbi:hypothetical protein BDZ85DRAFT_262654 [Elsinoe ampelina]|uniref:Secreted protein n=1 Tax=Elsinoe ampelina TaxID=302913 RepID=A0A6A6GC10_9PEZI|nr:hypothetical protein BDZ85DRAFT_262654 [Elsinoe ampelina]
MRYSGQVVWSLRSSFSAFVLACTGCLGESAKEGGVTPSFEGHGLRCRTLGFANNEDILPCRKFGMYPTFMIMSCWTEYFVWQKVPRLAGLYTLENGESTLNPSGLDFTSEYCPSYLQV